MPLIAPACRAMLAGGRNHGRVAAAAAAAYPSARQPSLLAAACTTRRHFSSTTDNFPAVTLAIMGAPGVGKGTFASRLSPLFSIPTISTGDLIRAEIKAGSPIGQQVKALTERGELVPDEVVLELLQKRLNQPDAVRGFLLDGYPRRVSQAQTLASLRPIDLAVNLTLDEGVLVEKALARRVCSRCGNGYNLAHINRDGYEMPPLLPKVAGVCDKCSGALVTRADDTEPIIRERLRIYQRETHPIIDFYARQGRLLEFTVKKGVADLPDLKEQIEQRLTFATKHPTAQAAAVVAAAAVIEEAATAATSADEAVQPA